MAYADEKVFLWLNGWVGRFSPFDNLVELLVSDYLIPVGMALTLLGLWFAGKDSVTRARHQIGLFVALTSLGLSSLAVFIVNTVYTRPRPFLSHEEISMLFYQPTDSSFPSNPIAATFAIAASVWVVNRRVGWFLFAAAGVYAFARVYAGVHYPLDVVAGALIGIVVTLLVLKLRDLMAPITTLVIKAGRIFCLA